MPLAELLPQIKTLSRADKFIVMQFILTELAREENLTLQSGATYPILTPLNSHAAAHQLAKLLESGS